MCPDFGDNETFIFDQDMGAMISKTGEFSIRRCNPELRECKSKDEIDEFIKDLVVDIWAVFEKIDIK